MRHGHIPAGYFNREQAPNVLLTTSYRPSKIMFQFLAEMLEVLPCATFYKRQVSLPIPPLRLFVGQLQIREKKSIRSGMVH